MKSTSRPCVAANCARTSDSDRLRFCSVMRALKASMPPYRTEYLGGVPERHPCLVESCQKLSSIHESLTLSAGSGRSSERQVDAVATHQQVMSRLERQDAVIAKSGGTAPDDHVAMNQRHAARRVGSTQSSQQEDRRQPAGDG